jgi:hypothetical protein
MRWTVSHRFDPAACRLADRHYNRRKVGSPQFVPPGRNLVLLSECGRAVWVTSYPFARYVRHAWAGAWVNSLFRNEGAGLSSELILEAVAATRYLAGARTNWDEPALGLVTFVNAEKTAKQRSRHASPGACYRHAGFVDVGETKGGLVALRLLPDAFPPPCAPLGVLALAS